MKAATKIMFTHAVMAMLVLSTVLHLTGFVTPGWFFMKGTKVQVGLWYGIICNGENCTSDTVNNLDPSLFQLKDPESVSSVLRKYQVLDTIAVAACLIGILANIVHRKTTHKLSSMWSVAICIICIFISGILGLVTAVHFANRLRRAEMYYSSVGEENPFGVPYSIIFTGLGGLVSLINYTVVAYNIAMDRDRK